MLKTGPAFKVRVFRRDGTITSHDFATVEEANKDADEWDAAGHEAAVLPFFNYSRD